MVPSLCGPEQCVAERHRDTLSEVYCLNFMLNSNSSHMKGIKMILNIGDKAIFLDPRRAAGSDARPSKGSRRIDVKILDVVRSVDLFLIEWRKERKGKQPFIGREWVGGHLLLLKRD